MPSRSASRKWFWLTEKTAPRERLVGLREELEGWQIFFITISSVIGVMIFYSNGEALEVAGPSGSLLAFAVVGVVAACVMECVSELIQMFPTPNAIVEFVRVFVDEDLAWVIGIAYWYTYAAIFATQIFQAADFTHYWNPAQFYRTVFLYIGAPFVMLAINLCGVWTFGVIETIGGIIKVCMVIGTGLYMYIIHGQGPSESDNISSGFKANPDFAGNTRIAGCFAMPIIAYGFLGVETVTVTAYEARYITSLKRPSQIIAYFVLAIYLFCVIGEYLNIYWRDPALPEQYINPMPRIESRQTTEQSETFGSQAIVVIAALRAKDHKIAGFLNGCMMFSALSAANTSLYIASRVLYGMTRKISRFSKLRRLRGLGSVWNRTGVPVRALCASFVAFVWLPFLRLKALVAIEDLFEIMSVSASVSCLLVWASLCVAFIRYYIWFGRHKVYIQRTYPEHDRLGTKSQASTISAHLQPLPAIIGLVGSLLIVLVFTSTTWWSTPFTFKKFATAYGAPVVMLALLLVLKAFSRRKYVELSSDLSRIQIAIEILKSSKAERDLRPARRFPWRRKDKVVQRTADESLDDVPDSRTGT